ncbi:hypothetical protein FS749_002132 [Ceratobasidium sp. UAMH 11750]|nr:hypothetical protein FS749_002132 [Ceratobasidium sp. UAMH 11750]
MDPASLYSNPDNPFARTIEATISYDTSLMEKRDGMFRIAPGETLDDPDRVLLDAETDGQRQSSLPPGPASLLSKSKIQDDYKKLYDASVGEDKVRVRQMVLVQTPRFVRSPLETLSPITLSEMMIRTVHKKNYLLCRVISPSVRMVAIQAAIEDQNGDVADLALYHSFETKEMERDDIASLLPIGLVILIREPLFWLGTTGGNPTIRVDSPADVIFPTYNDPVLQRLPDAWKTLEYPDAQGYREAGNKAFNRGHLEVAIRAYTYGLALDPSASLCRSNRGWCHFKLGNFSSAFSDLRAASEDETLPADIRNKARYRMALVYYAMDRFTDAMEIVNDGVSAKLSPELFDALREKIESRLKEQAHGEYDWFGLHKQAGTNHAQMLDVADYIGPITVAEMPTRGGGRGVFTTRRVLAGELLIVAKPFAFASPAEFPKDMLRCCHPGRTMITGKSAHELTGRAARRLMGDRSGAGILFRDLYSGENNNVDSLSKGTGETENSTFLATTGRHWTLSDDYENDHIDIEEIRGIIKVNSFQDSVTGFPHTESEGIYLIPSLVNHSCDGTVVRFTVGSIVVMRASRSMQAGEEVTCSYIGGRSDTSVLSREPALAQWFGNCDCSLCKADHLDGEERCTLREAYDEEILGVRIALSSENRLQFRLQLEELVKKIQGTYLTTRTAPMHILGLAQRLVGFANKGLNTTQAIKAYTSGLESHGIRLKKTAPKRPPTNYSQLNRNSLIIHTDSFPSQLDYIFRCIKVMCVLAALHYEVRQASQARHWAVAALWSKSFASS